MYAVKHPLTFIYNAIVPRDWYANNQVYQNNTLWSEGANKSVYDPCPLGWCVIPDPSKIYSDFSSLTIQYYIQGEQSSIDSYGVTHGLLYQDLVWYPAAGYLRSITGMCGNVGRNGYIWSSMVNETYASHLNFNMKGINSSDDNARAYGFTVRCVQE